MYKVVRYVDWKAETLKDSNSHLDKHFIDLDSAQLETKKLSMDLILFDYNIWKTEIK